MLIITIVLPSFNEAIHISKVLTRLSSTLNKSNLRICRVFHIVVVDDGSEDKTTQTALLHTPFVLVHKVNLGKGAALKTGCDFAFNKLSSDYVIMMDSDEQHSVEDLQKFTQKISEGHDLILGVRSYQGMPFVPTISNKLTSFLINMVYGVFVPDIPSGYKAFSKQMYQDIKWQATGYEVEIEIAQKIAQKKLSFATVPIKTIYPNYYRGMTLLDGFKVFLKLLHIK